MRSYPPGYLDHCDTLGICPDCGESVLTCPCDDDDDRVACGEAHPSGCLCCADDQVDAL